MIRSNDRIMIIVPHDDDVTLSFGGMIYKYRQSGCQFKVIVLCVGGPASNTSRAVRMKELESAMKVLGDKIELELGPEMLDGLLSTVTESELVSRLDRYIKDWKPDVVLCGAKSEHTDHQALYRAFQGTARLKEGFMPRVFGVGTYPFSAQLYTENEGGKVYIKLDKNAMAAKMQAWQCHLSQQKQYPSPLSNRGVEIQSMYYGMNCGGEYAELIYLLRDIE